MEFKLRANIVMSRELTVEAENLKEAMDKAQAMMGEPITYKDLTMTKVYYDDVWMDGQELVVK